jgi:hypothetical protein
VENWLSWKTTCKNFDFSEKRDDYAIYDFIFATKDIDPDYASMSLAMIDCLIDSMPTFYVTTHSWRASKTFQEAASRAIRS